MPLAVFLGFLSWAVLMMDQDRWFDPFWLAASASNAAVQIFTVFQGVHDRLGDLLREFVEHLFRIEWTFHNSDEVFQSVNVLIPVPIDFRQLRQASSHHVQAHSPTWWDGSVSGTMRAVCELQERVLAFVSGRYGGSGVEDVTSGAESVEKQFRRRQRVRNRQFDTSHDLPEWVDFGSSLLETFLVIVGEVGQLWIESVIVNRGKEGVEEPAKGVQNVHFLTAKQE